MCRSLLFKKLKTIVAVFVMFVIIPFSVKSQIKSSSDFLVSVQGHYGYIIAHHSNMAHLIKGHIYGGEINYVLRTDGHHSWQQIHKYPDVGICALHLYLANPQQLGNMEALYPYINLRMNKLKRKLSLNLRIGVGLAYITKPYDRITNHQNNAIGSHINGFVNLRLNSTIMLSKSWRLDGGVGLTHASNGALKTPNLGLNMATLNLGLGYVFGNKAMMIKKDSAMAAAAKKWHPSIYAVMGIKELEVGGPEYTSLGLQLNMYKCLGYKSKIGGGIEMSYNAATKKYWEEDSVYNTKAGDILKGGIKFSYSFNISRLSLPIDFGYYFYNKLPNDDRFFHRIGLRYMVTKHVIANVTLLTHWARADYFEWGVGYEF